MSEALILMAPSICKAFGGYLLFLVFFAGLGLRYFSDAYFIYGAQPGADDYSARYDVTNPSTMTSLTPLL